MVYHGPSSGCRTCRTRRVKCDRTQPACNNCVRREQTCPGYADVFDGAHRPQNKTVSRRIKKLNDTQSADPSDRDKSTAPDERSFQFVPSTSSTSLATDQSNQSQQSLVTLRTSNRSPSTRSKSNLSRDSSTDRSSYPSPLAISDLDFDTLALSIPRGIQQDAQDTSVCFFFGYYAGTAFDPEARKGFNQLWKPMYLQAPAESSLRLATAAVTINIATMWCFRLCDARPAMNLFTRALAAAREALLDSLRNTTDDILMTILIFDLYEALVRHYLPEPVRNGEHKLGALAIIEKRGLPILETSQGRALIRATRHTLLPYFLASRKAFPTRPDHLFNHPSINDTKAGRLDQISVQLSRIQNRLWAFRCRSIPDKSLEQRRLYYEEIIEEALQIEELLQAWEADITDPAWLPEYVPRDTVMESIQEAGFYDHGCYLWMDLEVGGTWNLFSYRYILTLQIIRQAFADEHSLLEDPEQQVLLSAVNEKIQKLVDDICASVPFHLGDKTVPNNPIDKISINYLVSTRMDPKSGATIRIPSLKSKHEKRASASSGWILFPQLVNLWRLAEPEDDAIPVILRAGQLEWIQGQVKRLQKVYLFCEPVWFKRLSPDFVKP